MLLLTLAVKGSFSVNLETVLSQSTLERKTSEFSCNMIKTFMISSLLLTLLSDLPIASV